MAADKTTVLQAPKVDRELKALAYSVARPAAIAFMNDAGELDPAIPLPGRTSAVRFQARICGDVYCEIEGARFVSGTGASARAAFDDALRKAA